MNSKATFAVSMVLVLALVLGGGFAGYRIGTAKPTVAGGSTEGGPAVVQTPTNTGPDTGAGTNNANQVPGTTKPGDNEAGTSMAGNSTASGSAAGAGTNGGHGNTNTTGNSLAGTSSSGVSIIAGSGVGGTSTAADIQANGANNRQAAGTKGTSAGTPAGTPLAAQPQNTTTNNAQAGDATAGAAKFAAAGCAGCHGADAHGGVGPNLTLADGPKSWTLDQFTQAVREEKAPDRTLSSVMPKFSKEQLSDADVANIQAHLKTLN